MPRTLELKRQYNELLERQKKAEIWMDALERTDTQVEKWMPEYQKILAGLNEIINTIGLPNTTEKERLNGFSLTCNPGGKKK